jgi:hypothetical protein
VNGSEVVTSAVGDIFEEPNDTKGKKKTKDRTANEDTDEPVHGELVVRFSDLLHGKTRRHGDSDW